MDGKAIIVTGGSGPKGPPACSKERGDLVVCADSGYELAQQLGLSIDLWVGDFDSTKATVNPLSSTMVVKRSPQEKDQSDTELALIEARAAGYHRWVLLGGGGRRVDHLLYTYALFDRYGPPLIWQTGHELMYLVTDTMTFDSLRAGQTVSILPAQLTGLSRVSAQNLAWPLSDAEIAITSISLSNRVAAATLTVQVTSGCGVLVSFPVAGCLR